MPNELGNPAVGDKVDVEIEFSGDRGMGTKNWSGVVLDVNDDPDEIGPDYRVQFTLPDGTVADDWFLCDEVTVAQ